MKLHQSNNLYWEENISGKFSEISFETVQTATATSIVKNILRKTENTHSYQQGVKIVKFSLQYIFIAETSAFHTFLAPRAEIPIREDTTENWSVFFRIVSLLWQQ